MRVRVRGPGGLRAGMSRSTKFKGISSLGSFFNDVTGRLRNAEGTREISSATKVNGIRGKHGSHASKLTAERQLVNKFLDAAVGRHCGARPPPVGRLYVSFQDRFSLTREATHAGNCTRLFFSNNCLLLQGLTPDPFSLGIDTPLPSLLVSTDLSKIGSKGCTPSALTP